MSTLILDRDIPILTFLFLRESLRNWLLHCVPHCQICPYHFILLLILWAHSSVYSTSLFSTWLIVACPHQFIPIHMSTFLLSSPSALLHSWTNCMFPRWLHPLFLLLLQYPSTTAVHILIFLPPCPVHHNRKYTSPSNGFIVQSPPPATPPPPPTLIRCRYVVDSVKCRWDTTRRYRHDIDMI